jgi:hypothetical protein
MSSSLLLEEAEVLAEEPTAEDMEEGEVSAEAEPRESRNLCRFLAAKQRILWRACLSGKSPRATERKSTRRIQRKCANSPCIRGSGRGRASRITKPLSLPCSSTKNTVESVSERKNPRGQQRENPRREFREKNARTLPVSEEAAEADPRESRNLCRFLAAEQRTITVH